MLYYSLKRLIQAIPLLLGIATITFFIVHLAPGDPMDMFLNPQFAKGRGLDQDREVEMYWLKVEPPFEPLRNDPRWQEMLDKVGFPE